MNILYKIRKLPEKKKKIILWTGTFFVFVCFLVFYIPGIKKTITEYKSGESFIDLSCFDSIQKIITNSKNQILNKLK